ncbi:hypothetical protein ACFLUA_01190 [Chloroflexota bacterium]
MLKFSFFIFYIFLGSILSTSCSIFPNPLVPTELVGETKTSDVITKTEVGSSLKSQESPSPNPILIKPTDTGNGSIGGTIENAEVVFPNQELHIYTAIFNGDQDGEGFYFLDTGRVTTASINPDGSFQILNVPPGLYVLVVGPNPESAKIVMEGSRAKVIEVGDNQIIQLGMASISP